MPATTPCRLQRVTHADRAEDADGDGLGANEQPVLYAAPVPVRRAFATRNNATARQQAVAEATAAAVLASLAAATQPQPAASRHTPPRYHSPISPIDAGLGCPSSLQTQASPTNLIAANSAPTALKLLPSSTATAGAAAAATDGAHPAPGTRAAAAAAAKARAVLQARLERHPMSCLAHYNQAMELTRHLSKLVAYPSPLARGRSAFKLPGGEPGDAPADWRDQLGHALTAQQRAASGDASEAAPAAAGAAAATATETAAPVLQVDAAYLRPGCVLVVLEYSSRRPRAELSVGSAAAQPAGAAGLPSAAAPGVRWDGAFGLGEQRLALSRPSFSREQLQGAFGLELVRPGDLIESQHFAGPTGAEALLAAAPIVAAGEEGTQNGRGGGAAAAAAADPWDSAAELELPNLDLLGPPCLLAGGNPLQLRVATAWPHAGGGGSSGGPPRILARYGQLDCPPQPCAAVVDAESEALAVSASAGSSGSSSGQSSWADNFVGDSGDDSGDDLRADVPRRLDSPGSAHSGHDRAARQLASPSSGPPALTRLGHGAPAVPSRLVASTRSISSTDGIGQAASEAVRRRDAGRCVRVSVGPCPRPGLLLLELDLSHGTPASAVNPALPGGAAAGGPEPQPLLSAVLPLVVVDDPAVERELNGLAAAAASAAAYDPAPGGAAPAPSLPAWFRSFLYDMGAFLGLQAAEEEALQERHRAMAAALAAGVHRRRRAAAAAGPTGSGAAESVHPTPLHDDYDDSSDYDEVDSDNEVADGSFGQPSGSDRFAAITLQPPGHPGGSRDPEEQLLALAAGLASYACRQGLPATLSYLLAGARRCGVPLLALDAEVRALCGGLGLGHLSVQAEDSEVLQALLLHARPPHVPSSGYGLESAGSSEAAPGSGGSGSDCGSGRRLAALSDCTALFVAPAPPGGITPLHLAACTHPSRSPEVAQLLLSLCPLAAHAWFEVRDAAGNNAAQYALRAGNAELNEQCMEQLVLEALEAAMLGGGDADDVTAAAMATARTLAALGQGLAQGRGHETSDGPARVRVQTALAHQTGGLTEEQREPVSGIDSDASWLSIGASGGAGGPGSDGCGGGDARGTGHIIANCDPGTASPAQLDPAPSSSPSGAASLPERLKAAAAVAAGWAPAAAPRPRRPLFGAASNAGAAAAASLRSLCTAFARLPWTAPLRGFDDPALEAAFAARAEALALARNTITLGFYSVMLGSCLAKALMGAPQQPPVRSGAELLVALGPGLAGLLGPAAVAALRLRGLPHDGALLASDCVRGLLVGGVHLAGLPHPQAFEVADVHIQEALTTLFDCLILPAMVQFSNPVFWLLHGAVVTLLMEAPMLRSHGPPGTAAAAAALLAVRFTLTLTVRYALALWARAEYLRGRQQRHAGAGGAGAGAGGAAAAAAGGRRWLGDCSGGGAVLGTGEVVSTARLGAAVAVESGLSAMDAEGCWANKKDA
ncbi:hypothetical protein GPECTOR_9g491 [Gonium pectorale]|uniref:Uncharacterized protein n=1 Tax=Gonium pectorale TaxID=33097 RepID=A0A150GRL3_GONPE|nr:hypothetical protein GPECTOR_9g491 [Gonium pectorale]|eukprot:KXZ52447.1 hypothetical protein GPECTOR_9g491 [Gonium pectorale]